MSRLDKIKERIGAYKAYLAIIAGLIVTIGAGVCSLYLGDKINGLFWLGVLAIVSLSIAFAAIARDMHRQIDSLENM